MSRKKRAIPKKESMTSLNQNLSPEERISREIKSQMIIRGIKQTDLAKKAKVHRAVINMVIAGKRKNPRLRRLVAQAIGKDVTFYWPDTA